MFGKDMTQVFGIVPKTMKRRMVRLRNHPEGKSESQMIREALESYIPSQEIELFGSPNQEWPAHGKNAVGA